MKAIRIVGGAAVGLFAGVVLAAITLGPMVALFQSLTPVAMPSDTAMIANWQAQRETFDQLVTMAREDARLKMIGPDWIEPPTLDEAGIAGPRLARYRVLLTLAGAPQGLRRSGDTLRFIATSYGMVHGASKAYVYRAGAFDKYDNALTDDLEAAARNARAQGERHFYGLHALGDGWFLERRED